MRAPHSALAALRSLIDRSGLARSAVAGTVSGRSAPRLERAPHRPTRRADATRRCGAEAGAPGRGLAADGSTDGDRPGARTGKSKREKSLSRIFLSSCSNIVSG